MAVWMKDHPVVKRWPNGITTFCISFCRFSRSNLTPMTPVNKVQPYRCTLTLLKVHVTFLCAFCACPVIIVKQWHEVMVQSTQCSQVVSLRAQQSPNTPVSMSLSNACLLVNYYCRDTPFISSHYQRTHRRACRCEFAPPLDILPW